MTNEDTVLIDIEYRMCEGLGTLSYAVAQDHRAA